MSQQLLAQPTVVDRPGFTTRIPARAAPVAASAHSGPSSGQAGSVQCDDPRRQRCDALTTIARGAVAARDGAEDVLEHAFPLPVDIVPSQPNRVSQFLRSVSNPRRSLVVARSLPLPQSM